MTITLNQPYSFCQLGKRDNQEDCRYPNSNEPDSCAPFFIVCDGVGGSADGEVASMAVAEGMADVLNETDWHRPFTHGDLQTALNAAYQALDAAARQGTSDMATTLTMVCFHAGGCMMVHMGDSRIYHFRTSQGLLYCSSDHSLINELVHAGVVSPDKAATHPQRNVISRYMAPAAVNEERCQPTCYETTDIAAGDVFLLCTDGVTNVIDDDTLEAIVCGHGTDKEKRDRLAQLSRGSADNNTAYLVSIANVIADPTDREDCPAESDSPVTMRIRRPAPVAVDLDMEDEAEGWGSRVIQFFKKTFKL